MTDFPKSEWIRPIALNMKFVKISTHIKQAPNETILRVTQAWRNFIYRGIDQTNQTYKTIYPRMFKHYERIL